MKTTERKAEGGMSREGRDLCQNRAPGQGWEMYWTQGQISLYCSPTSVRRAVDVRT
jgi:hypothetical protein